ncbi:MAG: HAD hydrolase-like protein [Parcubacteria group bacterium]
MINGFKAVIFDFDGTLLDVYESGVQFLIKLFNKYDLELSDKKARSIRDRTLPDVMGFFNESLANELNKPPVSEEEVLAFLNQRQDKLFPDALTVLSKLKMDGALLLLVSNRPDQDLAKQMRQCGLDEKMFFYVKGVYGTPFEKPRPDAIAEAVALLRHERIIVPDQIIAVGDHLLDWQVAVAWNIRFFALTCGVTTKQKFLEAGLPEHRIFDSLSDLFLK